MPFISKHIQSFPSYMFKSVVPETTRAFPLFSEKILPKFYGMAEWAYVLCRFCKNSYPKVCGKSGRYIIRVISTLKIAAAIKHKIIHRKVDARPSFKTTKRNMFSRCSSRHLERHFESSSRIIGNEVHFSYKCPLYHNVRRIHLSSNIKSNITD